MDRHKLNRRQLLGGAALAAGTAALPVWAQDNSTVFTPPAGAGVRNNISSFRTLNWQDYFANTTNGVILVDITSRTLHYWSEDQTIYKLYPTSVPLSEDLTRRGRTEIIKKVVGPDWRPTPEMRTGRAFALRS